MANIVTIERQYLDNVLASASSAQLALASATNVQKLCSGGDGRGKRTADDVAQQRSGGAEVSHCERKELGVGAADAVARQWRDCGAVS